MADGGGLCRGELAPGGVPTKNLRAPRGARHPASSLTSIASKLAPTGRAAFRFSKLPAVRAEPPEAVTAATDMYTLKNSRRL
ncbi:hypothetical protein CD175_10655 [Pseudomonas laurylsulfatiphila]|uniref:Uncharacterized protein n=1 Tax=Pseudomonas laurylsulfatiphila TaxID=2011015 RepID=A0A2S6FLE7_9PSED|nr:hypothetical protein CD175_10655 [Pseudomonas laurylsulfatiphila]